MIWLNCYYFKMLFPQNLGFCDRIWKPVVSKAQNLLLARPGTDHTSSLLVLMCMCLLVVALHE